MGSWILSCEGHWSQFPRLYRGRRGVESPPLSPVGPQLLGSQGLVFPPPPVSISSHPQPAPGQDRTPGARLARDLSVPHVYEVCKVVMKSKKLTHQLLIPPACGPAVRATPGAQSRAHSPARAGAWAARRGEKDPGRGASRGQAPTMCPRPGLPPALLTAAPGASRLIPTSGPLHSWSPAKSTRLPQPPACHAGLVPRLLACGDTHNSLICLFSAPHLQFHWDGPRARPGPGRQQALNAWGGRGGPHFTGGGPGAQRDGLRSDREWCLAGGVVGSRDSWWGPSEWPEGCHVQEGVGREGGEAAAGGWPWASSVLGWEGPRAGAVSVSLSL